MLFQTISAFSVLIAVLLSFFKIKTADRKFLPFILFLYAGLITEIINTYQNSRGIPNDVVTNIYAIMEILLLIWLFSNWALFKKKGIAIWLGSVFIVMFIADNFFLPGPHSFNPYFNIIGSLCIVIMSILTINRIILTENRSLIKNPVFIACTGFIIYFTYLALVEIFYVYGIIQDSLFSLRVYRILTIINLFTNLIYAMVIIWIPRKRYSLL